MAESDLNGRNIVFQIKNADGTPFHDLVLHKAVVDSVVMSLGDKISGDVYYKDNTLDVSMGEYVTFNGVDYVLINPPTIVKEGMVSENGEMNGMTKYSFTFYHPMCMLANFPFSDVAVSSDDEQYKSQDKSFSWIGYPDDYIAKLNKNLQNTTWVVVKSERFPEEKDNELSEVLTFDNNTIADALKTGYETWEVPYIVGTVQPGQYTYTNTNNQVVDYYDEGKRFVVIFGLPFSEIYETPEDETQDNPFVFHYGQGVGLKNNSRTPRNNKIITRIAGYGSEDNIPYGYPQIIWYGNQDWEYTAYSEIVTQETITKGILMATVESMALAHPEYEDSITSWYEATKAALDGTYTHDRSASKTSGQYQYEWEVNIKDGYIRAMYNNEYYDHVKYYVTNAETMFDVFVPEDSTPAEGAYTLYMGIVGGAYVKLIHHPYTRKHLMPSIYSQCVFNKVSPYISGGGANIDYDPTITLIDYYDAISDSEHQYPNPIVPNSPSYESHQFEDIKPELGYNIAIVDAYPINNDGTRADDWDSTMDEDGNYLQSYFKVTLPVLSFDIYACAAITQEMTLVMRGGACLGCSFDVQVDWDDYKLNFYDSDGNFAPDGAQRNLDKYPKSNEEQITVIVQKDLDTFGILMPNIYQKVLAGDTFVVIGISLPLSYITNAEERLDEESKSYMLENNIHYFDYPLKFDEFFLANNVNILQQIQTNSIIRFGFANDELELYVKQLTIKYGNAPLPQYDITLTDNVEITLNAIGQVADDVEKLSSLIALLRQSYNRNVWGEIDKKLSRVNADTANGLITFLQGIRLGNYVQSLTGGKFDESGNVEAHSLVVRGQTEQRGNVFFGNVPFVPGATGGAIRQIDNDIHAEVDYLSVRKKMAVTEVEIQEVNYVGGNIVLSPADGFTITDVEWDDGDNLFYVYFESRDADTGDVTVPQWHVGDLAFCEKFNIQNASSTDLIHRWWREVQNFGRITDESSPYYGKYMIWLRNDTVHCETVYNGISDWNMPMVGDKVVMLGHIQQSGESATDAKARQGAIILASAGGTTDTNALPYIRVYKDINTFDLSQATLVHQISYSGLVTNTQNWTLNVDLGDESATIQVPFNNLYNEIEDISSQLDESFKVWHVDYDNTTPPSLSNLPASQWGGQGQDPYSEHVGDFCITSDGFCYEFKNLSGTDENVYGWVIVTDQYLISYVEQIGEKKRVFVGPNHPSDNAVYEIGDLWVNAVWHDSERDWNNVIAVCISDKDENFDIDDWQLASTELENFINDGLGDAIMEQLDSQVVSYFTGGDSSSDDPSTQSWGQDHVGDTWYVNSVESNGVARGIDPTYPVGTDVLLVWTATESGGTTTYAWDIKSDPYTLQIMRLAYTAQDTADGKRRVFIQDNENLYPAPPYDKGDLWVVSRYPVDSTGDRNGTSIFVNDLLRCNSQKSSGQTFSISDWALASDYGIVADKVDASLKVWETSTSDPGGASVNEFIGIEFEKTGTSTLLTPIWQPKQGAGFKFTPTSAAIQMYFKNASSQYKMAQLAFDIDEDESIAKLHADSIKLEGYTTINDSFGVDLDGNMWAKNGRFGGLVTHEQTIISPDNYLDYGYIDDDGNFIVDIKKCGQYVTFFDSNDSRDYESSQEYMHRFENQEQHAILPDTTKYIFVPLPFVCDYEGDGNGNYDESSYDGVNGFVESRYDGESWVKRYFVANEIIKAREYVGCQVTITNRTFATNVKILGVKGYGQTTYTIPYIGQTIDSQITLECVSRSADFTQDDPYVGQEEIVWELKEMRPRIIKLESNNASTRYFMGLDDEYKYSEDSNGVPTEYDDVIQDYKDGKYESHEQLPPIIQPTLDDIENRYINTQGVWYARYYSVIVDVSRARGQYISANAGSQYAFLTSYNDTNVTFVSGGSRVGARPNHVLIPNDAVYIYLFVGQTMPTVAPVFTLSEE